jgi:hypothetical protein
MVHNYPETIKKIKVKPILYNKFLSMIRNELIFVHVY